MILLEVWEPILKNKLTIFHIETKEASGRSPSTEDPSKTKTVSFEVFDKDELDENQNKIKRYIKKWVWKLKFGLFQNEKNKTFYENPKEPAFIVSNGITDKAKRILLKKSVQVYKFRFYVDSKLQ